MNFASRVEAELNSWFGFLGFASRRLFFFSIAMRGKARREYVSLYSFAGNFGHSRFTVAEN